MHTDQNLLTILRADNRPASLISDAMMSKLKDFSFHKPQNRDYSRVKMECRKAEINWTSIIFWSLYALGRLVAVGMIAGKVVG